MPGRPGLGGLRRATWPLLAVAILVTVVPGALAQEPPPGHSLDVLETSVSLMHLPPFNAVSENYTCGTAGTFDVDPVTRNITFRDSGFNGQCGEARVFVQVPGGATSIVVNFTADRRIRQQTAVEADYRMREEFKLRGPNLEELSSIAFYDAQSGPSPARSFEFRYVLPIGMPELALGWFFADDGARYVTEPQLQLQAAQVFQASVTNVTLRWLDVPLPSPAIMVGPEEEHPDELVAVAPITANLTVTPAMVSNGDQVAIRMVIHEGPDLVRVVGPKGELIPGEVQTTSAEERQQFRLSEAVVAAQGHGVYSFEFLSARTLAPIAPPTPPTRVYPFFWAMLLLPIPAGALAISSANAYRREAEGPYLRTARAVLALILAIGVYYLFIAYFALFQLGPRTMAVLPPTDAVLLVYGQLLLVVLLFVGIAILQARARTGAMRRDIDERRRKEDRLRRSNEELERFAYVASHDLQEPLRKVAGFTALLQKRYGGRLDKDADEIIQYAVDGASRMQMLIKDILAYSRVGSKELNRVPVDANDIMGLVVGDLGEAIQQGRAKVLWQDLPTVRADASQLRQVLQNLVENAIKYRHPKRRPKVEVFATADAKAWHFAVRDNGQGIPADKHEEIFGIFRRLHGQSTPGTGIGLAVAKKAIERHDGRIWVESVPGKGSTFHFTLPRSLLDGSGPAVSSSPGPEPARPSDGPGSGAAA
ncbi:MAG TPA: ATP-binding protein [Candidatus Thermoplasmatota archaeon]|nr:ATP-binding protein [Candidatus Thermoplasmatota archaeon]